MSITKKTLLIVFGVAIPLFAIIIFISNYFFLNSFEALEQRTVEQNLYRSSEAIEAKIKSIESMSYDWANWDETYLFALNGNQNYVDTNLGDATFIGTGTNLIFILDASDHIVYSKAFDLNTLQEMLVPADFYTHLDSGRLTNHDDPAGKVAGILMLSDYPLLVVSKPILTSDAQGPIAGTFIAGVIVDSKLIDEFAATTNLSLDLYDTQGANVPEDVSSAMESLSQPGGIYINPVSQDSIVGYQALNDIYGQPSLIVRVNMPRDIYANGHTIINYLHWMFLGISSVFLLLLIWALRKVILSRMIVLDKAVLDISKTGDTSKRIKISGKDELSRLAGNINKMLDSLEEIDAQAKGLYEREVIHRRELEEEVKARAQFIHVLAHELRTPLTPIMASVETLHDLLSVNPGSIPYKLVKNARAGTASLSKRLEELLDLARFSRGVFKLKIEPVEPTSFLENVTSQYSPALASKHQKLVLDIQPGLPQFNGDPSCLEQVVLNLLSNASKYSPDNSDISLKAKLEDRKILFDISDKGIGISEEDQKKLFLPYHRVQQDRQSIPGIGLGLAVSKQIIEAHGGQIWIESQPGKGSSFKFTIPVNN